MSPERLPFDANRRNVIGGISSADSSIILPAEINPSTGRLLVDASFSPSGTQDINLKQVNGSSISLGQTTMSASLPVAIASDQTLSVGLNAGSNLVGQVELSDGTNVIGTSSHPIFTNQTDQSQTFSISANATSGGEIDNLSGVSAVTVQMTGSGTHTLQVQVTVDGSTWVNITGSNQLINAVTGAYIASGNITANGIYQADISGCSGVRVITTAYTSGPAVGIVKVTNATAMVSLDGQPTISTAQSGTWTMGSKTATLSTGQKTLGSSSTQMTSTSVAPTNGVIVQALSGNAASVYVGVSGVTTSTGFELQPGQAVGLVPTNQNVIYGISTNGTDGVCWVTT